MRRSKAQKNRRSKAAKISHYRLLKVLDCFARDLTIKQAHALTRVSERSLRDLYAQIRLRMVMAALSDPDVFGGFNALVTNSAGQLEPEVLTLMAACTRSGQFKERLRRHYPRTNVNTQPMLFFAVEYFVRRFVAIRQPRLTPDTSTELTASMNAAAALMSVLNQQGKQSTAQTRHAHWTLARAGLNARLGSSVHYHLDKGHARLLRDLKSILLNHPL